MIHLRGIPVSVQVATTITRFNVGFVVSKTLLKIRRGTHILKIAFNIINAINYILRIAMKQVIDGENLISRETSDSRRWHHVRTQVTIFTTVVSHTPFGYVFSLILESRWGENLFKVLPSLGMLVSQQLWPRSSWWMMNK